MEAKVCVLSSGSCGNSVYIEAGETSVLVDSGLSGAKTEAALKDIGADPCKLDAVLVTHEHRDHTAGVGVLCRRYSLPMYATEATISRMKPVIGDISDCCVKTVNKHLEFEINDVKIRPFEIPHDAADPVGYSFCWGIKKITVATDIGHMNRILLSEISGSNLLVLESNHDRQMLLKGSYPWHLKKRILGRRGHLSNAEAGMALSKITGGDRFNVVLAHLSEQNNLPNLAYETVQNILEENGIRVERDISLNLAYRNKRTKVFYV